MNIHVKDPLVTHEAFEHLDPTIRHLATADDRLRVAQVHSDPWVTYPEGEAAVQRLFELLDTPQRIRMPSVLFYAKPNMGKTRIIRRFEQLFERRLAEEGGAEPPGVVRIQAPPTVDEKRLYVEILTAVGAAVPDTTVARLRSMVVRQLEVRRTRVLIIDEMQHILGQRLAAIQVVLNTLKYLSNELQLSIAGFGTGEARSLVKSDPHLAERFEVIALPEWRGKNKWLVEAVRARIALFPLRCRTEVDRELVETLYTLADGKPGRMFDLLERAALAAMAGENSAEWITPKLLQDLAATLVRNADAGRR